MENSSFSINKLLFIIYFGAATIYLFPFLSFASDLTLTWTQSPEPLTGYKLYYDIGDVPSPPYDGVGINEGNSPIFIDKVTEYTITGLIPGESYHFVLTAYNQFGETNFTNVVSITPEAESSPVILNISIK
ncbi:MAG: fibronectin type III domain-containing protein [Desulfobulbaceae bacterium]|nr:fibronectin type III domain-containing protein [Desulfobulbaceae bacterium]